MVKHITRLGAPGDESVGALSFTSVNLELKVNYFTYNSLRINVVVSYVMLIRSNTGKLPT